jgi:hypothetical protein
VCDDGEEAENKTEAVEQGWGAAKDIVGGQAHAVTDESGVVDEGAIWSEDVSARSM